MAETSNLTQAFLDRTEESLAAAQLLLTAALYDDAVSRACYAMFYAAKAALESINIDAHSHSGAINQFGLHFIKSGQIDTQYGRMLAQAFQSRQASDYDVQTNTLAAEAQNIVTNAKQFIAEIRTLLSETS